MSRVPTEKQYDRLRILANGSMVLTPGRREWTPLLNHGWVAAARDDDGSRFLPPLRITTAGLLALAAAVARYGLPPVGGQPRQLDEPPFIAKLRRELDDTRVERDRARREAHAANLRLAQIKRLIIIEETSP